jgi:osmotically-inducible protein OsmY
MKGDVQIERHVIEELANDPLLDTDRITTGVSEGTVTLQGVVPSLWQKSEAENAVRRVRGVSGVANELTVELPGDHQRDDVDIVRAAEHILSWHSDLPKTIQVSVSNGWLTLSGAVRSYFEKDEAERAVRYLSGVKGIVNTVDIKM